MDVSKYPIIYCIYNANGTFLGELKYMVNKYLYGLKCSMCEITHNTFTKKKQWISKISGLVAKALARPTLCCIPPDN